MDECFFGAHCMFFFRSSIVLNIVNTSMFFNFTLFHSFWGWIVISLFLIFGDLEPRCSYKIVLITKDLLYFHLREDLANYTSLTLSGPWGSNRPPYDTFLHKILESIKISQFTLWLKSICGNNPAKKSSGGHMTSGKWS